MDWRDLGITRSDNIDLGWGLRILIPGPQGELLLSGDGEQEGPQAPLDKVTHCGKGGDR